MKFKVHHGQIEPFRGASVLKLYQLLDLHRKFSAQGVPDSFGDGYLIAHNRFYRQIREAALAGGFRLTSELNDPYQTFPLLQLESILQSRTLPFAKNVLPLEQLSPTQQHALSWEDIDGNLKKNFVFHEGAHAVIRGLNKRPPEHKNQRLFALRMLFEESCANTAELLGTVELHDQAHRIFYSMNSYMTDFEHRTYLKTALKEIGEGVVIRFLVLFYLQANFLRDKIEDRDFQKMARICAGGTSLDAKKTKTLRSLSKIAFLLSERFRQQTTGFHLRLAGIQVSSKELFDFDFLADIETPTYAELLKNWVAVFSPGNPRAQN